MHVLCLHHLPVGYVFDKSLCLQLSRAEMRGANPQLLQSPAQQISLWKSPFPFFINSDYLGEPLCSSHWLLKILRKHSRSRPLLCESLLIQPPHHVTYIPALCSWTGEDLNQLCSPSSQLGLQVPWAGLSAQRIDYAFRSGKEGNRSASEEPMASLGPDRLAKPCGTCLTIELLGKCCRVQELCLWC